MRYCFALDLKNEPHLIEEYIQHHQNVWPEIKESITESGISKMEIHHIGDRLFMIMETTTDFSFEKKHELDANNKKVQEWETLMEGYQQRLTFAQPAEKWVLMNKIFEL